MKTLRLAVALAPLLLAAPPSLAADAALEEAKALVSQATVEYNVGRFEQSLELYTKAYERYQKPALLFNIGQCHRLLGHYERALFFYHGFLREQPDSPNRALAERHIEESQRALDAQRAAEAAESQRRASQVPSQAPAASAPPATATPQRSVPAPVAPAEPSETHPPAVLRIAGLATVGAGVILLGTGVALGLHAASLSKELTQVSAAHGTWSAQYQSDYEAGKSAASAANVLYVLGSVAIAGGAVLTWIGWPKAVPVGAAIAPLPGGASGSIVGRF